MLEITAGFFINFFKYPTVLGIGLAIVFGIIWFTCFWPPLIKQPWHWAMIVGGAFITLFALSFIQRPLQNLSGNTMKYLLLSGIPTIFISGFIQEAAKLVPPVIYWWRKGMNIDYKLGLTLGAAAGVGFGILEAQWIHNLAFAMGWSWDTVRKSGIDAFAPFIERFFVVAFSTGSTALVGYGLAKGKGWQFYLIVAILHATINYSIFLVQAEIFTIGEIEIFIALLSLIVIGIALWLRWRKTTNIDKRY
jgi:RsiW-degrading membrane proteinase PrsW (M82 family)